MGYHKEQIEESFRDELSATTKTRCMCGHNKGEHWYSGFVCNTCGCTLFRKERK